MVEVTLELAPTGLDPTSPTSLAAWVQLYGRLGAAAGAPNTVLAKGRDLALFLAFFHEQLKGDHPDQWTRPITEAFLRYLEDDLGHQPTSINRVLASLRHCARWIHQHRAFLAGDPTECVRELVVDAPLWKGLSSIEVLRLRSATEHLTKTRQRKNQMPLRDRAIVTVLLATGLRISELLRLDLAQYDGRHFIDVRRKGKIRTRKVFLAKDARTAVHDYLTHERGPAPGALFVSRRGLRLERQHVDRLLKLVAAQANVRLPLNEHLQLSAHKLRHTFLRKVTHEHGVEFAMDLAGHTSAHYIWRYVKPSDEEKERALERLY